MALFLRLKVTWVHRLGSSDRMFSSSFAVSLGDNRLGSPALLAPSLLLAFFRSLLTLSTGEDSCAKPGYYHELNEGIATSQVSISSEQLSLSLSHTHTHTPEPFGFKYGLRLSFTHIYTRTYIIYLMDPFNSLCKLIKILCV